jgi:hypothetical protein
VHDSGRFDWFLETEKIETNTGYLWVQQSAIIIYNEQGSVTDFIARQKSFETFEYGYTWQDEVYNASIKPFRPSEFMKGVIHASINYNCGGCLTNLSVSDKFWSLISEQGGVKKWYEFNNFKNNTPSGVIR